MSGTDRVGNSISPSDNVSSDPPPQSSSSASELEDFGSLSASQAAVIAQRVANATASNISDYEAIVLNLFALWCELQAHASQAAIKLSTDQFLASLDAAEEQYDSTFNSGITTLAISGVGVLVGVGTLGTFAYRRWGPPASTGRAGVASPQDLPAVGSSPSPTQRPDADYFGDDLRSDWGGSRSPSFTNGHAALSVTPERRSSLSEPGAVDVQDPSAPSALPSPSSAGATASNNVNGSRAASDSPSSHDVAQLFSSLCMYVLPNTANGAGQLAGAAPQLSADEARALAEILGRGADAFIANAQGYHGDFSQAASAYASTN